MAHRIIDIVQADSRWRAIYEDPADPEATELARVAAWALVERDDGARDVVGLVVDGTRLVPASEAGALLRYGYRA